MPKRYQETRKFAAEELIERLAKGPVFHPVPPSCTLPPGEVDRQYQIWVKSWILPVVEKLIPELRHKGNSDG